MRLMKHGRSLTEYAEVIGWQSAARLCLGFALGVHRVTVSIPPSGARIVCRPATSDRHVLGSVIHEHRGLPPLRSPRFIIDAGANIGVSTVLLAEQYPDSVIYAVEPDAENFQLLEENCRAYAQVRCIHAAVWDKRNALSIANPESDSWARRVSESVPLSANSVQGVTIGDLISEAGVEKVDLLKMDIEGAEERVFCADVPWLDDVQVLCIEIHSESAATKVEQAVTASHRSFTRRQSGEKFIYQNRQWLAP